jgi:hypothetical protein
VQAAAAAAQQDRFTERVERGEVLPAALEQVAVVALVAKGDQ